MRINGNIIGDILLFGICGMYIVNIHIYYGIYEP